LPHWSEDELRRAVASNRICAITLDTTTFHRLGYNLEALSLRPLSHLFGSGVEFVLSDTVSREVQAHMLADAKQQVLKVRAALREFEKIRRVGDAAIGRATAALQLDTDIAADVARAWHQFETSCVPTILEASTYLDGQSLVDLYFAGQPPFGAGRKKDEFPDAIALLELAAYAKARDGVVLAVSHDDDWRHFALVSPHIVVTDDLARSVGLFHDAGAWTAGQLAGLLAIADSNIAVQISRELEVHLFTIRPEILAHSQFDMESDFLEARYSGFHPVASEEILLIEQDGATAVVAFDLTFDAEIDAVFGFFAINAAEAGYDEIGASTLTRQHEVTVRVVARIPADLQELDCASEIGVEGPSRVLVPFGDVWPDFG